MPRYNSTANGLASLGRNGDTMLMHVNPQEVAGLSALLGSEPTVNPDTGLPEAFNWGGIISGLLGNTFSLVNSAAIKEPLEELIGESDWLKEFAEPLSLAGSGLVGAATNAGIGALGAGLTGGNAGDSALAGALSGGAAGLYGGLEAENIVGKPAIQTAQKPSLSTDTSLGYGQIGADEAAPYSPMEATQPVNFGDSYMNNLGRAWDTNVTNKGGFKNFVKEHGEPLMMAGMMQSALEQNFGADELAKKQKERQMRLFADAGLDPYNLTRSYSFTSRGTGYADGGAVGYATEFGIPTQVKIPQRYIDELQRAGGIGALGMTNPQYAQGGYINTKPFDPNAAHPLSMVDKAKPSSVQDPGPAI